MAILTFSRLLGSGGDDIALKAAEGLGYDLVDSSLIISIAEQAGVSVEEVRNFDEQDHSRAGEWLKSFITPRISKIMTEDGEHLNSDRYMNYLRKVIQGLADKGNMVIVGRCAQFILEDYDNAFHVRIIADDIFRAEFIKARQGISLQKAQDVIKKSDKTRKSYIERYFKRNWSSQDAYHMILDSSRIGIDVATAIIVEAVKTFSYAHEYVPGEKDRRADDRRSDIRRKGERRDPTTVWTHRDMENAMIREGRPIRTLNKPDRREDERREDSRRD